MLIIPVVKFQVDTVKMVAIMVHPTPLELAYLVNSVIRPWHWTGTLVVNKKFHSEEAVVEATPKFLSVIKVKALHLALFTKIVQNIAIQTTVTMTSQLKKATLPMILMVSQSNLAATSIVRFIVIREILTIPEWTKQITWMMLFDSVQGLRIMGASKAIVPSIQDQTSSERFPIKSTKVAQC